MTPRALLVQFAPFVDPAVVAVGWLALLVLVIVRRQRMDAPLVA